MSFMDCFDKAKQEKKLMNTSPRIQAGHSNRGNFYDAENFIDTFNRDLKISANKLAKDLFGAK